MVDEHGSAKSHVLRFAPQFVVHDLRACHGVDHEQRGLGGLHGRQGVAQEVRLARRVDQVDLKVLVRDGRQRGADGEAAADLFVVVIQVRFPVVRGAHAGRFAGDVEHGLSERGLARAVLAYKHDVSYMFGSGSCHGEPPTFLLCGQVPCHLLRAKGTVLCRALHKQNNGESVSHFPRAAVGDRSHSRVSRRNLKRERRHAHGEQADEIGRRSGPNAECARGREAPEQRNAWKNGCAELRQAARCKVRTAWQIEAVWAQHAIGDILSKRRITGRPPFFGNPCTKTAMFWPNPHSEHHGIRPRARRCFQRQSRPGKMRALPHKRRLKSYRLPFSMMLRMPF